MGDGETPSSAEALVFQKVKQRALEEAGTYVQSYTEVRHLDLTVDEIKTIAGGVMQTEILEQKRQMEGTGLRLYVKIKAVITTDTIEALSKQKQLSSLAQENKKLQDTVSQLSIELEGLKRRVADAKNESEREAVLDKIRDVEKQFRQIRSNETALYRRLLSGQELAAQVDQAFKEEQQRKDAAQKRLAQQQEAVDRVLDTLRQNGIVVSVSPPQTEVSLHRPNTIGLRFTVSVDASSDARAALQTLESAYRGQDVPTRTAWRVQELLDHSELVITVVLNDGQQYEGTQSRAHNFKKLESYDIRQWVKDKPYETVLTISVPRNVISEVASVEGKIRISEESPAKSKSFDPTVPSNSLIDPPSELEPYLKRVYQRIQSFWSAPPIDVTGGPYLTRIRFRLHRDGSVSQVAVQRPSGNEYYDLSAKRAVLSAIPLPKFPDDVSLPYIDTALDFRMAQ